jgi:hypothetical protein
MFIVGNLLFNKQCSNGTVGYMSMFRQLLRSNIAAALHSALRLSFEDVYVVRVLFNAPLRALTHTCMSTYM